MELEFVDEQKVKREQRAQWGKQIEFILVSVGYAVGLGNIWRFPYLCHKSGGGAFLVPYLITLISCSIPLVFMEIAVGQFTQRGPVAALAYICPLFKGTGVATTVVSFLWTTYYNIVITWVLYYLIMSFYSPLPWTSCDHSWNSANCWDGKNITYNSTCTNLTSQCNGYKSPVGPNETISSVTASIARPNGTVSPTQDFYERFILEQSDSIDNPGTVLWQLALLLLAAWIIVFFCIFKGPKSTGKVVYFTATFPYLVFIILLVRGLTLSGSVDGVLYFITPRWHLLLNAQVWLFAAQQSFNSLGIGFGGIIAMASYNRYNNNVLRDAVMVPIINTTTSIIGGFVIFSILGHLAWKQGTSIDEVVSHGPGLVFIVYPEVFDALPAANVFAVLFFFTLLILGIDSQFTTVEVVVTTIQDKFGPVIKKYLRRKEYLVAIVCLVSYLCGFPHITHGGIYFFQVFDYYAAGTSLVYVAFFESVAVLWIYGTKRLSGDIEKMTGKKPSIYIIVCWYMVPLILLALWLFSVVNFKPLSLDRDELPTWSIVLGYTISFVSVICIPVGFIHTLFKVPGRNLWQKLKNGAQTTLAFHKWEGNAGDFESEMQENMVIKEPMLVKPF